MIRTIIKISDGFSWLASLLANASVVILTLAMVYEVFARYLFDSPTVWSFDIAYMANGAMFILGIAYVLRKDGHIRISVLRDRFSAKCNSLIQGIVYILILTPFFGSITWVAGFKTYRAWIRHEVETVSPWAPLMWPFYLLITIGLLAMTLQLLAEGLRGLDQNNTSKIKEA